MRTGRPVLLPEPCVRWGLVNPVTGEPCSNEDALRQMCDYGAEQVTVGKCDFLALNCMPGEVAFIKAYMAERYPTVNYAFGTSRQVLSMFLGATSTPKPADTEAAHSRREPI